MGIHAHAQMHRSAALEPIELLEYPVLAATEVELEVLHCGVCHSDLHLLDGDWGDVARPLVPGHEIVGRVTRLGADVARDANPSVGFAEGAVVGVGWQAGACFSCAPCTRGEPHLCTRGKVRTCVGRPGGFAERVRVDHRFCFALPAGLDARDAAPLLCAGLTVFSPMKRLGIAPGAKIAIVGLGGLGHLAVQFAAKMGARVTVFDVDASRAELAQALGTETFASVGSVPVDQFDRIFTTTHAALDWNAWMNALTLGGTLCLLGVPKEAVTVSVDPLLDGQKSITGSVIGSPDTMREMLQFAGTHGIRAIVEHMPMAEANQAIERLRRGEARLRIILDRA
jgi:alcohol/geraniol dehydrogenase (NADP+)